MGDFITNPVTPDLYLTKAPAPGATIPPGLSAQNVVLATDMNVIEAALLDCRTAIRAATQDVQNFGGVGDGTTDNTGAFAAMAAAVNAVPNPDGRPVAVTFPTGHYRYSGGLDFTRPVLLVGNGDVTLDYIGTGKAVTFGPPGLTSANTSWPFHRHYGATGVRLTGGAAATHGFYFAPFVTMPRLHSVEWYDYGQAGTFGAWFESSNWDVRVVSCRYFVSPTSNVVRRWLRVNGAGDNGQSRLSMLDCVASDQGLVRSFGVYVNGFNSELSHCKIEGFRTNVQLGPFASGTRVRDTYFEHLTTTGGAIAYGADPGDANESNYLTNVEVENCYANLHTTDLSGLGYFLFPANTLTGLQSVRLRRIRVVDGGTREVVQQNNLTSQTDNAADGVIGGGSVHTTGASITVWNGTDGQFLTWNRLNETTEVTLKAGLSATQNHRISFRNHNNTERVAFDVFSGNNLDINAGAGLGGTIRTNSSFTRVIGGMFGTRRITLTYGTTINFDSAQANEFVIDATNATAFTINAPTNPSTGQRITMRIRNTSGGALGAVTWNAVFKMSAWTQPASANSRAIDFQYDGTNWVECGRVAADVPN